MLARLLAVMCLTGMLVGCGGDSTRGVNRDRDRPRAASEKDKGKVDKGEKGEKEKVDKGEKK